MIGLAGSNTQDPFGTGVTAIELYLVKTAFSSTYSATEASFLGGGGGSNSAGISLQSGSWYRMSIDAAYNTTNSRYDCLFTIYASDAAGSIGQQLFSMTNNGLRLVPSVYGFVASSGPGGAMGIAAIDNFSFPTVSEPSSVLLICMALSPFLAGRFLFRPRRNPMGS